MTALANFFRRWRLRHRRSSFDTSLLALPISVRVAGLNISSTFK